MRLLLSHDMWLGTNKAVSSTTIEVQLLFVCTNTFYICSSKMTLFLNYNAGTNPLLHHFAHIIVLVSPYSSISQVLFE